MLSKRDPHSAERPGPQIQNALLRHIATLPEGACIPPETQLCGHFNVSRMTVNKAIKQLVVRGFLRRVQGKGTFVNRRPAAYRAVKVLLPGPNSFDNEEREGLKRTFDSFCQECHKLSLRVEAIITTPDHQLSSLNPEMFYQFSENDMVFVPAPWWVPIFEALSKSGAKVVFCDSQLYKQGTKDFIKHWHVLEVDNKGAAKEAMAILARAGKKRITGMRSKSIYEMGEPMDIGFLEGLAEHGLQCEADHLLEYDWHDEARPLHKIEDELKSRIIANYRKKPFDGVATYENFIPIFVAVINEMGLRIPDDVALISYGDSKSCRASIPPISAFTNLNEELGREAARAFSQLDFAPGVTLFTRKFIDRGSV